MTSTDHECWSRVRDRLRAEVGDDVYQSWFARMELEGIEPETVRHSVPTRFLRSWIQSHYAERLLACWQSEQATTVRIERSITSFVAGPHADRVRKAVERATGPALTLSVESAAAAHV